MPHREASYVGEAKPFVPPIPSLPKVLSHTVVGRVIFACDYRVDTVVKQNPDLLPSHWA